jgi:hypothetical protein
MAPRCGNPARTIRGRQPATSRESEFFTPMVLEAMGWHHWFEEMAVTHVGQGTPALPIRRPLA